MYPIVYSNFPYYHIDPSDLDGRAAAVELLGGALQRMVGIGIDEPCCQVVFEDFFPGYEYRWTIWLDQIDLVTGKAEISVLLPPELERTKTFIVEAPSIYLIPRGTPLVWKIIGDEVFRHFSFDVPNPMFPTELARSVKAARKLAE